MPFDFTGINALNIVFTLALVTILASVFIVDLRTRTIPDGLWISLAVLGVLRLIAGYAGWLGPELPVTILGSILGALLGCLPLLILALLTDGFGGGDIKLMFAAGIYLGWETALAALLIGCLLGGVAAIIMLASGHASRKTKIAFGPYLALGIAIAALWGETILATFFRS
ncbi:MAG: A24 family peptidase [Coriobacteriia bacterium]|nr:A24 family peptidase [Coriobacteriia bacterium]